MLFFVTLFGIDLICLKIYAYFVLITTNLIFASHAETEINRSGQDHVDDKAVILICECYDDEGRAGEKPALPNGVYISDSGNVNI